MSEYVPFAMVVVGIALRTVIPYLRKNLTRLQKGKDWEPFEKEYLVPPLATIGLALLGYLVLVLIGTEFVKSISVMDWRLAILTGIGGQESLREMQKLFTGKE